MYWELVATQKAYGFSAYSIAADTRADSVLANPGNTSFMVSAHVGTDEYIAFQSNTVIGHSVDNLAPVPPLALISQRVGNYVYLKWNGVHLPDMKNYAVYRLSLIHISEPTRLLSISYAVFCLKKKKKNKN